MILSYLVVNAKAVKVNKCKLEIMSALFIVTAVTLKNNNKQKN